MTDQNKKPKRDYSKAEAISRALYRAAKKLYPEEVEAKKDFTWKKIYDDCETMISGGPYMSEKIRWLYFFGENSRKYNSIMQMRDTGLHPDYHELSWGSNNKDVSFVMATSYIYFGLRSRDNVLVYDLPFDSRKVAEIGKLAFSWLTKDGMFVNVTRVNENKFNKGFKFKW